MKSCAFFGHRNFPYDDYRDKLIRIVRDLIENEGVTQFYSGLRGSFDRLCCYTVYQLKKEYPHITNTLVLSYMPDNDFMLPKWFDDSVYILEKRVMPKFAIIETNKCLVDKVDFIVAGVLSHGGGAYAALYYAFKKKKPIISVIDGWEIY